MNPIYDVGNALTVDLNDVIAVQYYASESVSRAVAGFYITLRNQNDKLKFECDLTHLEAGKQCENALEDLDNHFNNLKSKWKEYNEYKAIKES